MVLATVPLYFLKVLSYAKGVNNYKRWLLWMVQYWLKLNKGSMAHVTCFRGMRSGSSHTTSCVKASSLKTSKNGLSKPLKTAKNISLGETHRLEVYVELYAGMVLIEEYGSRTIRSLSLKEWCVYLTNETLRDNVLVSWVMLYDP